MTAGGLPKAATDFASRVCTQEPDADPRGGTGCHGVQFDFRQPAGERPPQEAGGRGPEDQNAGTLQLQLQHASVFHTPTRPQIKNASV